jgi:uncharacterized damage-inducible protein DinB
LIALGDKVYAQDKWTVKQMLQHIIDTERIFTYRILRISRGDKTPLPGFEENDYANNAKVDSRTIDDLIREFALVRESSKALISSIDDITLLNEGIASGNPITAAAISFAMLGHLVHHISILEERYFPLIGK